MYKILNHRKPQELASVMTANTKSLRISKHMKLDTRPRWLGSSKLTRSLYRTRAYYYNTLPAAVTTQPNLKKCKNALKNQFNKK